MKKALLLIALSANIITALAQSASWTAVKPAQFPTNVSGQIHGISRCSQMKFHATNSNKMYAVSARGGLFITTDGGNNWAVTPGTDFMTSMRFASVCVDHTNDQVIYLGTGDHNYYYSGSGVYKSTDGGQTFSYLGLSGKLVCEMVMDPLNNNTIVAVTQTGIYKTTNAGTTWTLKSASRPFDDLKHKAPNSRTLYASTNDSAFFRSTDFGDTWTQITSGITLPSGITNGDGTRIAVTPADTNVVYLGMVANGGMLYKSTNGGTSFTAMKTSSPPYLTYYDNSASSSGQGDYNFSIGVDRTNAAIVYLVSHNNWKSTNSGATWTQLTNWYDKCHTDMHQIITSPYNNNNLYNVNDGGIFLSTDGGNNWTPKSDGMFGYEIYQGNCSPTRKDMMSIGTQDNGELYATNTGWFTNRGGDWGSKCAFDYRPNSSMVYYFQNNKRRLVTGGDATYGLPVTSLNDMAFHRSNQNLAFAAKNEVYRTTNLTNTTPTWTQITAINKPIQAVHASIADPNKLFIITDDATLYVSTNAQAASPTFTPYTIPNSTNNNASITTVKNDPNVVYITANTQVYRSANNGASWTNIKYNLPSVNHVRILSDEYASNELVFIASGTSVYYKTANATSWTLYNQQLPTRTEIVDMSFFNDSTANTALRVATYGRGMWETPITNLRSLNANFAADNTNPCPGQSVSFSDLSTGDVTSRSWTFTGGSPATSTAINPVVTYTGTGSYNVRLIVSNASGSDTLLQTAYINTTGASLPLAEGFEGADDPSSGWKNIDNGTSGYQWTKTTSASGFGASVSAMFFDNYSWNVPGEKDELIVKRLNFSGYTAAKLSFDVAYQVYSGYADSLKVLASTDCGATWTPLYSKGGTVLSTAGTGTNNFVPTASEWRTDTVNLNSYLGNNSVLLAFQNVNGYGNKLYLDNVNITGTVNVVADAGPDKNICVGASTTIGVAPISGISYSWTPTTGLSNATISNPTASPTSNTTYILTATHIASGAIDKDTVVVTTQVCCASAPATPGTITASSAAKVCPGETRSYSITPVSGANSYNWIAPTGATVSAGQGTTTATVSFGSGFSATSVIQVAAVNTCGSSAFRTKNVPRGAKPAKPSPISGQAYGLCGASPQTYNITPVSLASSYLWSINSSNATIASGQGTTSAQLSYNGAFPGGILSVSASNGCGVSAARTLTVYTIPAKPASMQGPALFCPGQTKTYTTPVVAGVTSYTWDAPSGATISDGTSSTTATLTTTSNTVTVTHGTNSGYVKVKANNACGSSGYFQKAVTNNCPQRIATSALAMSIIPNPATDAIAILYSTEQDGAASLKIYDAAGKMVMMQDADAVAGSNQIDLRISELAAGIYQVVLSTGTQQFTGRFIKE